MNKINEEIYRLKIIMAITIFIYIGHCLLIFRIIEITINDENFKYVLLLLIPLIYMNIKLLIIGIKNLLTIINLNTLLKTGTFYKNLDYISSTKSVSKRKSKIKFYQPIVNFIHPNGNKIIMKGKFNKDILEPSMTGKIDLVVDLKKPSIYYIDFDID